MGLNLGSILCLQTAQNISYLRETSLSLFRFVVGVYDDEGSVEV